MPKKAKPVHEVKVGRIRAAIWANVNGDGRPRLSFTVTRLYRDGNEWRDSNSFFRDDAPVVAKVSDMVFSWLVENEADITAELANRDVANDDDQA